MDYFLTLTPLAVVFGVYLSGFYIHMGDFRAEGVPVRKRRRSNRRLLHCLLMKTSLHYILYPHNKLVFAPILML